MKILFLGDVYGEAGRKVVQHFVPMLKQKHQLDCVIANIENLAAGAGITPKTFAEMLGVGIDLFTGGNHSLDKKEGRTIFENDSRVTRPANYPPEMYGQGSAIHTTADGNNVGVINLMGRIFMEPMDCPFRVADEMLENLSKKCKIIVVDIHAEATSEKLALAWYLAGRCSLVVGTHTHVQTADERILAGGTAYISDAGMCGPHDGVIGVQKDIVIEKFLLRRGRRFEPATGEPWLCGVILEVDPQNGQAQSIQRVKIEYNDPSTHP